MKYTKVSADTFNALQLDAGVLLTNFDPTDPAIPSDADIICATTGGINIVCTPTYSDFAEDIDNAPNNVMEFKHLDGWECSMGFSSVRFTPSSIALGLGAQETTSNKVVPRRNLSAADFADIWWVGDKADGGAVAIRLMNGLSTDGLNITTTKNGKGTIAMTISGHVSLHDQDTVPMEFYVLESSSSRCVVNQILSHVTSSFTQYSVEYEAELEVTLLVESNYEMRNVVVTMAGEDITSTAYDAQEGVVHINSVTSEVQIIATAVAIGE